MTGIQHSTTEIVCSIDADGSYDAGLLLDMIPLLRDDVALVTASPYHPRGAVRNAAAWRIWLSRTASRLYRLALRNKLTCYTCCVRVYRRSVVEKVELSRERFAGIPEMLWRIDRRGWRVVETPAVMGSRAHGASKLRVASTVAKHLGLLAEIAIRRSVDRLRRRPATQSRDAAAREENFVRERSVSTARSAWDSSMLP